MARASKRNSTSETSARKSSRNSEKKEVHEDLKPDNDLKPVANTPKDVDNGKETEKAASKLVKDLKQADKDLKESPIVGTPTRQRRRSVSTEKNLTPMRRSRRLSRGNSVEPDEMADKTEHTDISKVIKELDTITEKGETPEKSRRKSSAQDDVVKDDSKKSENSATEEVVKPTNQDKSEPEASDLSKIGQENIENESHESKKEKLDCMDSTQSRNNSSTEVAEEEQDSNKAKQDSSNEDDTEEKVVDNSKDSSENEIRTEVRKKSKDLNETQEVISQEFQFNADEEIADTINGGSEDLSHETFGSPKFDRKR